MAFKNEYVPESAYEKYDMKKICAAHNQPLGRDRHIWFEYWTVDYEKDAFLVRIHSHRDDNFHGYAFYWKGEWMFFDARVIDAKGDSLRHSAWVWYQVKGFTVPDRLKAQRDAVIADLKEALINRDTVDSTVTDSSGKIDFFGEEKQTGSGLALPHPVV